MPSITPCLWFDTEGEAAAELYTATFPNSRITEIQPYVGDAPRPAGEVMTVAFELDGQPFVALNGGPQFKPNEAISFQVPCDTQDEIDHYTERLTAGGGEQGPCGWVKDRFGISWQVFPKRLIELVGDPDREKAARAMDAMLKMRKIDLAAIEEAAAGGVHA